MDAPEHPSDAAAAHPAHGSGGGPDPVAAPAGIGLRATGFLLTAAGALLAGVGSVLTWVTVGIDGQPQVDTASPGLDTPDGVVVLAAAVISLVGVLASRLMRGGRRPAAVACLAAGLVMTATAGAFLLTAGTRYEPVGSDDLIANIAADTGEPVDVVRERLSEVVAELGGFTRLGPGPYLALAGGLAASIGAVLVLAWVVRGAEPPRPDEPEGYNAARS